MNILSLVWFAMQFSVAATVETAPSIYPDDSVDDIAIWVHPQAPEQSLVIATLKASNQTPVEPTGLLVYDMNGQQKQFLPVGTPNNVDIAVYQGRQIVVVSHWYSDTVQLFEIDATTMQLEAINSPQPTGLEKLRGTCAYVTEDHQLAYYAVSEAGPIQRYVMDDQLESAKLTNQLRLKSGAEGCVVDTEHGTAYFSEESKGIWQYDTELKRPGTLIAKASRWFGPLKPDIEGLAMVENFLIASSQGNSRFVVFDRTTLKRIGSFKIRDGALDGTSGTDGIEATSVNLGPLFPEGIFIAQDDANLDNGRPAHQNFKFVPWQLIREELNSLEPKQP